MSLFVLPDTPLDVSGAKADYEWRRVCLLITLYTRYMRPAVAPMLPSSSPPPPPFPSALSLSVSVYASPSQLQWHIEGTAFRLVNLMEPLTRSVG